VVKKRTVHSFTHYVVSPEGEGYVAYSAACERFGTGLFYLPDGLDEIHGVGIVFFDPGSDSKYVRVKDYVAGVHAYFFS